MVKRIWLSQPVGQESQILRESLGISSIVADILVQRGLRLPEEAIDFLRPSLLNQSSPFNFRDMAKVIERMTIALKQQEKVLVYGDFDVDGVTSTALLYKVLIDLGFQAVAYIPNRQDEGYGLNDEAVERAAKAGVRIIITVDCGITAVTEAEFARTLNIDVIITDHHEPPDVLPEAFAILNPKAADSGYPFKELAGVGVAFKLGQALLQSFAGQADVLTETELLDLVALGTIADLVPLVGENRVFVHYGLRQMAETRHLGLEVLLEECGLKNKTLKSGQIGFIVAPRINAAGRMDSAKASLELLLTEDDERARELARFLTRENQLRQETEKEILTEAIAQLEGKPLPRVIVLSADNWHHGVIGIVASRLVERYYRPVFMIAEDGLEARGSARGIPGYPVLEQLSTQAHLLTKFGGHKAAAGFSLLAKDIGRLREGLNQQASSFQEALFQEELKVDRQIPLEAVTSNLLRELEHMAPFGFGNPGPVLASKGIPVYSLSTAGKDQSHLKFRFGNKGELEGIAFRLGDRLAELNQATKLDVVFSLDWNTFRGPEQVQLVIKDIQAEANWREGLVVCETGFADAYREAAVSRDEPETGWLDWRSLNQGAWPLPEDKEIWIWDTTGSEPTLKQYQNKLQDNKQDNRDENKDINKDINKDDKGFGIIYGLPLTEKDFREGVEKLRQMGIFCIALAGFQSVNEERVRQRCGFLAREELIKIYRKLLNKAKEENPFRYRSGSALKRHERIALRIFEELGLIRCLGGTDEVTLAWLPAQSKLDLESSLLYRYGSILFHKSWKFQSNLLQAPMVKNGFGWKS